MWWTRGRVLASLALAPGYLIAAPPALRSRYRDLLLVLPRLRRSDRVIVTCYSYCRASGRSGRVCVSATHASGSDPFASYSRKRLRSPLPVTHASASRAYGVGPTRRAPRRGLRHARRARRASDRGGPLFPQRVAAG